MCSRSKRWHNQGRILMTEERAIGEIKNTWFRLPVHLHTGWRERSESSPTQQETAQPSPSNYIDRITCCPFHDLASSVNPKTGQRRSESCVMGVGWDRDLSFFMIFSTTNTEDSCEPLSCLFATNQSYLQGIWAKCPFILLSSYLWWQVPQVRAPPCRSV